MPELWQDAGFGIYLHWPFCAAKCPYCDFNSHVAAEIDQDRWARAYLAEIDRVAALVPGRRVDTVFFGGGTPSLMAPSVVASVLERIALRWDLTEGAEITLEANPTSVEAERFRGYASAGVNRVSMGIQALNDADLKRLGRLHSVDEALAAFDVARAAFGRVSFDLIYARQDQVLAAWEAELGRALGLAVDHLSLYQLTIEDGTAFGDRFRRGRLPGLPDEDRAADLYAATQELTAAAGLPAYEISNHARPGAEARHNLIYWESGDYAGIGPGAHGRLTLDGVRMATETPRAPGEWLETVERGAGAGFLMEAVPGDAVLDEFLMMGLRLRDGVDVARLETLGPGQEVINKINELVESGHLERRAGRLAATELGRPVLNAVLRAILA